MNPQFNLVDEGWIPCIMSGPEPPVERRRTFGLRDVLVHAPDIQEISDPSPLATAALHRLLLAIVHRIVDGPSGIEHWAELWERKRFDSSALESYLRNVYARFNLFDERCPFYQVASIGPEYGLPVAKLTHELAAGNNVTLFDHTSEAQAPTFTPAQAASYLVAFQAYAVGGLVSFEKGQDPKVYKSAPAAPLVKGAVALVRGENLFETLMLNLHEYDVASEVPFPTRNGVDRLAWEREEETRAQERPPDGYLDLLTWQSRRIRLFPTLDEHGQIVARRAAIMKGYGFPNAKRNEYETMVAFWQNTKASPAQELFTAIGFRADRAMWRDSLALLQSADGNTRPKTISWLHRLEDNGALKQRPSVPLDLLGMLTDQASVLLWRHERLPLPLVYLGDEDLVAALKKALGMAEAVGNAVGKASKDLSRLLLAPDSDRPDARQPARADVDQLAKSFGMERAYWPRLEAPFKGLLKNLPQDKKEHSGFTEYGAKQLPVWIDELSHAARNAFDAATAGLGSSARSLKAVAKAQRRLNWEIARALKADASDGRQKKGGSA